MPELKVYVPTYNGDLVDLDARDNLPEFGDPQVPIVVRRADGLRIVLGSVDYFDASAPDIQIERRPQGWAILLTPMPAGEASGVVCFLDDGRSFVVPDEYADKPLRVLGSIEEVPDLNTLPKRDCGKA